MMMRKIVSPSSSLLRDDASIVNIGNPFVSSKIWSHKPLRLDGMADNSMLDEKLPNQRDIHSRRTSLKLMTMMLAVSTHLTVPVLPAEAAYGDSTNIELPSYIDFLIESARTVDPDSFVYKGDDRVVLLGRVGKAASKLDDLPAMIEKKKWSEVQGVLTGPMGTLVQTMGQLGKDRADVQEAAKKVKTDVLMIGQMAAKKDQERCLGAVAQTKIDLSAFVKVAAL
mmetsp:Transcript_6051/g.8710  ORF Transcript_6051/g.8710 Transcript_6051/m.8710 type:complete len:225 (+) Transcript_6051:3-677(+)